MLVYSMSVSLDGFVTDRTDSFRWTVPDEELFGYHLEQVSSLGGYLTGRRLYEVMLPWETDPTMRATELGDRFADVWGALGKVVFSRTLEHVEGNARLAAGSVAQEIATALDSTDQDISIGGADLAAAAIALDLVDELRMFRCPVVLGGGTSYLPPVRSQMRFGLVQTRTFGTGVIYERYRRIRPPTSGPDPRRSTDAPGTSTVHP
ncbi:Dihydrofolate reductase [Nakamurella panacisegetis]|uniref:Dihydrofolate reductase n=1 Tax=Nakamurella panacisegetis TaxID=1090615 RepID=A0A1H0RZY7_9ACTN|nr:dihydrofolate reductase family protein [Nakamurella panacisegetis]SDP34927.1 Dihydrofolate reductase [Nakamurella panacisegetis]